ncbi:outer membrane protein assembly factor BamC [Spiribacter onubensis]|uniref:Outer membrane protein assembly factor BamC n=1 Tax=Spiribacter onubensis TaxID=3122420 RepID=A0ABV3S969_9GAMM
MRHLAAMSLAALLAGCSWMGGEPTEEERIAERLAQPPDVLSDAQLRAAPTQSGDDAVVARDGVEIVGTQIETDPESALSYVDGRPVLDLGLPLEAGWAIVGRALDRTGFELVSSDRAEHIHLIRYDSSIADDEVSRGDGDGDGMLSSLAFWRDEPESAPRDYRIAVVERGKGSRVSVQMSDGEPAARGASRQVLAVLAEQLKP